MFSHKTKITLDKRNCNIPSFALKKKKLNKKLKTIELRRTSELRLLKLPYNAMPLLRKVLIGLPYNGF